MSGLTKALQVILASGSLVAAHPLAAEPARAPLSRAEAIRLYGLRRDTARHGIEGRVRQLAKGLELDKKQQAELRTLLESEHKAIQRVWADRAIAATDRVGVTRAILDRTADLIRAMLTEEQREHYPAPRSQREPPPPDHDLEYWLKLTERSGTGEPAGVAN